LAAESISDALHKSTLNFIPPAIRVELARFRNSEVGREIRNARKASVVLSIEKLFPEQWRFANYWGICRM
jgi:hypothetical protein